MLKPMSIPSLLLSLSTAFVATDSSAESRLVFMREHDGLKQVWIADAMGRSARPLTDGSRWALYPDISADGVWVAFAEGQNETSTEIVLMNPATGTRRSLTAGRPGLFLQPRFSGNGKFLAYSGPGRVASQAAITVLDLASGSSTEVAAAGAAYFPALSSDGFTVFFQENLAGGIKRIARHDLIERKTTYPAVPSGTVMAPSISADNLKLAYTALVDGNWDVYVTDLLTGTITRITQSPARDFAPTFRPDGSLVFASDRDGGVFQLYATTWDTQNAANEVALAPLSGDLYSPNLSGEPAVRQGSLADIPAPARSSFGTARVGSRIYVMGGHQGAEHTYPRESFLDHVEIYDLATNTWRRSAPRPVAAHGYALAVFGKYIYAFGGFAFSDAHRPGWKSLDVIHRFDTETETWEEMGRLPRPRSSNAVVVAGARAYLLGGWDSTPRSAGDAEGKFHGEIDVYDFVTGRATDSGFRLPDPLRRAFTAVERDGKALLIGGLGQGSSHFELLDRVTEWDPASGQSRELPRLPFATFAPAAGIAGDDSVFVFGGMFKTGARNYEYVNHVFQLLRDGSRWSHTGRYLSENKGFAQVVELDGALGVLGGHSYDDSRDAPVPTFEWFSAP